MRELKEDWGCTIVRAAMGVEASGGYLTNRAAERVVWQVHKEAPRIKPKPRRVPGDELTCWRSRLEPCFPVAGYIQMVILTWRYQEHRDIKKQEI